MKKRILSVLLTVALLLLCLPLGAISVGAATYTRGVYVYTVSNGKATIIDIDQPVDEDGLPIPLFGDLIIPSTLNGYPVTAIGNYAFYECDQLSVTIPDGVTSIGAGAFMGCFFMKSATIPDSVTTIGNNAFKSCSSLTSVTLPDRMTSIGEGAFSYCYELTSITIPDGVTHISDDTFISCDNLTSVTLPDSVTSIGEEAFGWCNNLTDVYYGGTQEQWAAISDAGKNWYLLSYPRIHFAEACTHTWQAATCSKAMTCSICHQTAGGVGGHNYVNGICRMCKSNCASAFDTLVKTYSTENTTFSFYEASDTSHMLIISGSGAVPMWSGLSAYAASIHTIVIQEGLTAIPYGLFGNMTNLNTVVLPSTLTTINGEAFKNCTNLTTINLPEGLTTIGYAAFMGSGLAEVTVPDSVTTMGKWVFANCKQLASVTFGASKLAKKTIPTRTFSGCTALKNVDFGTRLQIIDDYAFNQCGVENLTLPANIKTVDNAAFYRNPSLRTVTIADGGATYLGWASFYGCTALENIDLGNSLTNISTWVFTACDSLKEITIPNTVTNIGRCSFKWCTNLEMVVLSDGMTAIKDEMFVGCSKLKNVTLPSGLTSIGALAFRMCRALTSLDIPEGVTVASNAFVGSGLQ